MSLADNWIARVGIYVCDGPERPLNADVLQLLRDGVRCLVRELRRAGGGKRHGSRAGVNLVGYTARLQ